MNRHRALLLEDVAPLPAVFPARGAFCIPDALPGIPYGDRKRIWTPAFSCYGEVWQQRILRAIQVRGYRWLVYNCAGKPYHDDYPELADDPEPVRADLTTIATAGLVAVVCATDDRNPRKVLDSFKANADLIPVCFPAWEMNGPFQDNVAYMKQSILDIRAAAPNALCFLHFTAGHGALYEPEAEAWRWCQDQGVAGLFSQDDHWDDPKATGEGLESTALRLNGTIPAWHGLHLKNIAFEQQTTPLYHSGRTEAQGLAFTREMLKYCPSIAGWCDSGVTL